jgi:hypothetical protein
MVAVENRWKEAEREFLLAETYFGAAGDSEMDRAVSARPGPPPNPSAGHFSHTTPHDTDPAEQPHFPQPELRPRKSSSGLLA